MFSTTKSKSKQAVLWLDQERLYLGLQSNCHNLAVHQVHWNPERLDIQSAEACQKLTDALVGIAKQFSLSRTNVRLCLDDGLCVTRVVTGAQEDVGRELDAIRVRSQLYLSLGLGEKLTGNLSIIQENQSEYALTSIVNLRTMQAIYGSITAAKLQLVSIEPVTLSITRALGLLGVDRTQPVLFLSIDNNRCDLAVTRAGQLMLSYRISGVKDSKAIADQIESNLIRLRRFCERVRGQSDSSLQSIYLFGESESVDSLRDALQKSAVRLEFASVPFPESIKLQVQQETPPVVSLALWAASQWHEDRTDCLPAPDLLTQLQKLQRKSFPERLVTHFFPSVIAACLILAVSVLYVNDHWRLSSKKHEVNGITTDVSVAETELAEWEHKQRLIDSYQQLEHQISDGSWSHLIGEIAPCLPGNARLDSLTLSDDRTVTLRGTMVARDQTYEMLAAIKQLPNVAEVSLESVNAIGDNAQSQFQFEVKFRINRKPSKPSETSVTSIRIPPQIASN